MSKRIHNVLLVFGKHSVMALFLAAPEYPEQLCEVYGYLASCTARLPRVLSAAMEAEAQPFITKLGLKEDDPPK